jgi:hypothetical protein
MSIRNDTSTTPLAPWEFAGLLLTNWCSARCAFCYVHSGPNRRNEMTITTALRLWRELDELALRHGRSMRIHLAGGEPFGDWPRLAGLCRAARDAALSPLEKIETNAFWATDDNLTRARLELLGALGLERLVVSSDVFHQEFIPIERVQRCVKTAQAVLGRQRARVRWWDFYHAPADLRHADEATRGQAYQAALARHRDRLTGRAALLLADLLPRHPAAEFRHENCAANILGSRHVHIDAAGHIFPGVCSGIIIGRAADYTVGDIWHEFAANWPGNPVVNALVTAGSYGLLQLAEPLGYRARPAGYADKCHLCTHIRQFLFDRGIWPEHIGPAECYANAEDRRAKAGCACTPNDLTPPTDPPTVSPA